MHGLQPGSVEASLGAESTDELAVMIDTFAPWRWPARRGMRGPRLRLDPRPPRDPEAPLARSVSPDRWRRR